MTNIDMTMRIFFENFTFILSVSMFKIYDSTSSIIFNIVIKILRAYSVLDQIHLVFFFFFPSSSPNNTFLQKLWMRERNQWHKYAC